MNVARNVKNRKASRILAMKKGRRREEKTRETRGREDPGAVNSLGEVGA